MTNYKEIVRKYAKYSHGKVQDRDEDYVIDLCDEVLGLEASRQHRFDFLTGDTGRELPVDAYYEEKKLVVEYHEKQHTEDVPLFNRKKTASGVPRGEQRKMYDERRQKVLPEHGISLVIISYNDFEYDKQKRIKRNRESDLKTVKEKLDRFLNKPENTK